MERDLDVIIWAVLLLLIFLGTIIKWFVRRGIERRQEGGTAQVEGSSLMEELRKVLEGLVVEERPEITIRRERPHKIPRRMRVKEAAPHVPPTPEKKARPALFPEKPPEKPPEKVGPRPIFPAGALPKNELQRAVILGEVLGPPRVKRRHYRLF